MSYQKGLDISEHNTKITDYSLIKKAGYSFVIPREGCRERIDDLFLKHISGCKNAGISIPCVYHFVYAWTKAGVEAEAKSCIANVVKAGLPKTTLIWADVEYDTVDKAKLSGVSLGATEVRNITKWFCDYITSQGYPTGIYTNDDYFKNYYGSSFLSSYKLWVADYDGTLSYKCLYHQYTSSGTIEGLSGKFDCNYYVNNQTVTVASNASTTSATIGGDNMSVSSIIEKAITWMETTANDSSHGYDQTYRWGEKGDYDCSSAVITSWQNAGVPVKTNGATYTGNMYSVFKKCGFSDVTSQVSVSSGSGLQRGDVLLNTVHHVAMYCGNGNEVEASINEKGGATGGQAGDQTGKEFLIRSYRNYPWNYVLRYTGGATISTTTSTSSSVLSKGSTGDTVKTLQKNLNTILGISLDVDGSFGDATYAAVISFQQKYNLIADGEVGSQTQAKITSLLNATNTSTTTTKTTTTTSSSKLNTTQKWVGKVTANKLNVRTWAGKENDLIKSYPMLSKGNLVAVCDDTKDTSGNTWYYILIANKYYGFVSGEYIQKV